jgi:pimeloyl-ACP methyl ester carboxylesterase
MPDRVESMKESTTMKLAKDASLRVNGANLFYRVRGSGPLLLILPGGDGDADTADALRSQLIDRFTFVTYDRRGMSRSKIDAPDESLTIATHSDDAHRLLATLTKEPAFVCSSSIGALIGLDLVARYPEQVAILVAYEPPAFELLPEDERNRAMGLQEEAEEAFRREGIEAGFKKFVELAAVDYNDREPDAALAPPTSQRNANLSFFFRHDSPAVQRYRLDLAALQSAGTRIVLAVGQSAPESAPSKATEALAAQLGRKVIAFPGGHTAWLLRPKNFAAKLAAILRA